MSEVKPPWNKLRTFPTFLHFFLEALTDIYKPNIKDKAPKKIARVTILSGKIEMPDTTAIEKIKQNDDSFFFIIIL